MKVRGLRVGRPAFAGTLPLVVGKTRYGIPPGSRVVHVENKPLAYVLAPDGALAAFLATGQIFGIPPDLADLVKAHYFGNGKEDSENAEEDFGRSAT